MLLSSAMLCRAADVSGRLMVGGYIADEQINLPTALAGRNDVETLSSRAFLKISDWGFSKDEFIADLRDKNDFFGNVDKENLSLTPKNDFQVHQLSFLIPNDIGFTRVGRFSVNEAGAVTDGGEIGYKINNSMETAIFGGFNPWVPGQKYYVFNGNAQDFGAYFVYQPRPTSWDRSIYFSNAVVTEKVGSETDRTYWFESLIYQWNQQSRIIFLSYLDFVPSTYLQNGSFHWQQGLSENWSISSNLLSVDVIEYVRIQSLRSLLPASPYHEENQNLRYNFGPLFWSEFRFTSGQRLADGLNRTEYRLVTDYGDFKSHKWDVNFQLGYSIDFQSIDTFIKSGVAYYSRKWEFSLDEEVRNAAYSDGTYHPVTTEASIARSFQNDFFMTLSGQYILDERVKIMAGFFELTYRFGHSALAPIRDSAPVRGML